MKNYRVPFARQLRTDQTNAEKVIWYKLRNRQLYGNKFRRQQPIGRYIVDFVCYEKNLVVEIDGGQHNKISMKEQDYKRTEYLENLGYKVIRFWDNDVLKNVEAVIEVISNRLSI